MSTFSCKNKNEEPLLIDQNLTEKKITELTQQSITIKQLEEYTNVRNTKYGQDVLHKGETVLLYSYAESYNIFPEESRFLMKESDSITQINYNIQIKIVDNYDKIFEKLVSKVGSESFILFPVFVRGEILQVDCGGYYALELNSDDLYIP